MITILNKDFFDRNTIDVAKDLLGKLIYFIKDKVKICRIVETEAYLINDPACHAYNGINKKNSTMFKGAGLLYVYRIHQSYCMNITTKLGEAVLIRSCEPIFGIKGSTVGPGRLCKALGIDKSYDGKSLFSSQDIFLVDDGFKVKEIEVTTRIGVTKAKDLPLRFFIKDNKYVSKRN